MSYRFDREPQPVAAPKLLPIPRRYTFVGPYILTQDVAPRQPTIDEIKRRVSRFYGLPIREMSSERKAREVAHPRQMAMYLAKKLTLRSLPQIGKQFGGRDHTTVIHAVRAVEQRRRDCSTYDAVVQLLERGLSA